LPKERPGKDTREHARHAVRLGAEIRRATGKLEAIVLDVGSGGLGLSAPRALAEDEAVTVLLFVVVDDVEDERIETLTLGARVSWCAEADDGHFRCGLQLDTLPAAVQTAFDSFLRRLSR
jgi:hypothetical protein